MLIPSIDLMGGRAVQLVGGRTLELDAGEPRQWAERFAIAGEIAVVDLDAALGSGSNAALVEDILPLAPCRVGGGIRSAEQAIRWCDAGAAKVVLGTAARPEILSRLPRERVIAALDAVDGEVVVDGWRTRTGRTILEVLRDLRGYVSEFLVTFVEREGRLGGTAVERVAEIVDAAGDARVTIAGGITTAKEIATLDRAGADAQVGMALYKGMLGLAEGIAAVLSSDRVDGLWPTVITDELGVALGLAYSSAESLHEAVRTRRGVYHSRSRGLWVKGESSGAAQDLLRIAVDCDRDTLRFTVRQRGSGFCHRGTRTCWGEDKGLPALARRIALRALNAEPGSYTRRLLEDPALLRGKLLEEAEELAVAPPDQVPHEAADLVYFTMVAMQRGGVGLDDLARQLDARSLRLTRRPGEAK